MMKHEYILLLGRTGNRILSTTYTYRQTKGVELEVFEKGIRIKASVGALYDVKQVLGYSTFALFPDGVKKGLAVYLAYYSKPFEIKKVSVSIDGVVTEFDEYPEILVYSVIEKPLLRSLSEAWKNEAVLKKLTSFTKSAQDCRMASFYALALSKSKVYEAERFINLWMAFNGFYDYKAENLRIQRPGKRIPDCDMIFNLIKIYGLGNDRIFEKESADIAWAVIRVLEKWDYKPVTQETLKEDGIHGQMGKDIEALLVRAENGTKLDLSSYGYLLCFLAYFFRCNLIHADKPVPLFSYATEYEVRCLKLINQMLEDFLEAELPTCFA